MNLQALSDAAQAVLDHAVAALEQDGAPGAPARAYVSAGDPDADCDLLAVYAVPFPKPPAPQRTGGTVPGHCSILHRAEITVRRWQCAPKSDGRAAVDEGTADAYGIEFHDGLWAVWSYLGARIIAGDLIDGIGCSAAELNDRPQIDQAGDMAGWTLTLNLDLAPLLQDTSS